MMSTGMPSTLGNWHRMCVLMFGEDSPATAFVKATLDEQGADEAVLADEGQLILALMMMHVAPTEGEV